MHKVLPKGNSETHRAKKTREQINPQLISARPQQLKISPHSCQVYVYCYYFKGIEGVQEQRRNIILYTYTECNFFANGS